MSARREEEKARKLAAKAEQLRLVKENPSLRGGISSADVQSRIPNADERKAESALLIERDAAIARERNATQQGQGAAPQVGRGAAPAPQGGQSAFSGVGGRSVGFSGTPSSGVESRNVGFGGGGGSAQAPAGESFADTEARKQRESAASGAFGSKAQNLEGRKSLFAEMKAAADGSGQGGQDFEGRAKALGIDSAGFMRGVARAEGTELPSAPDTPAAPLTGRALARNNIATMGADGAAADYFKRADAEKAALQERRDTAVSRGFQETANSPAPFKPVKTFASMFGEAADAEDIAPVVTDAAPPKGDPSMFGAPTAVERSIAGEPPVAPKGDPSMFGAPTAVERSIAGEPPAAPSIIREQRKPNRGKVLTKGEFVDLETPLRRGAETFMGSFREEEAKGYKAPLRSFAIANVKGAKEGATSLFRELTGRQ